MEIKFQKVLKTKQEYDVVVLGGGTAGVVAAIASARSGANTLLVEKTGSLGGMMTVGNCGLTTYILHAGNLKDRHKTEKVHIIGGIPMELTNRLIEKNNAVATEGKAGSYVFTDQVSFKTLLNEVVTEAEVTVLFHTSFIDVVKEKNTVKGVVLHNKEGLSLYEAKIFVDATGDGDAAAAAGAEYFVGTGPYDLVYKEKPELLGTMGAMGVMYRIGNADIKKTMEYLYERTENPIFKVQIMSLQDYNAVTDYIERGQMTAFVISGFSFGDLQIYNTPEPGIFILGCPCISGNGLVSGEKSAAELDMTKLIEKHMREIRNVPGFEKAIVLDIPEIGIRETRHIIGEYLLTLKDILKMKKFKDSIGKGSHVIDISPVPEWLEKDKMPEMFEFTIPYRSLVVKGVDNMFVAGRCISCTHEASGAARVTVQCMITGEAAGTAAALCVANEKTIRETPFTIIKKTLLNNGVIL